MYFLHAPILAQARALDKSVADDYSRGMKEVRMPKQPRTWAEVRGAIAAAGVTVKDVEDECSFPRSILSRMMTFDPQGQPSTGKLQSMLSAIQTRSER